MNTNTISLLICALGGEGGGVLTDWLVETARHAGYAAQATSIPGVAQRTGATTYYLEVFPTPLAELGGKRPVFSLSPVPGALDAIVSSELLETARQIANGMATAERTRVISATSRTLTTAERMVPGDGRYDDAPLHALVRAQSQSHHLLDMQEMARRSGTVVSAVMFGALAASGVLPFTRAQFEAVVQASGGGAAASLRGFSLAFDQVSAQRKQADQVQSWIADEPAQAKSPAPPAAAPAWLSDFPPATHTLLQLGHARVLDYQNAAYADLYLERMRRVLALEKSAAADFETTLETARWLALWMAFDDIVRVADLKSRASRLARVREETKAQDGELLKVYEHFKPGVPEIAGLLPTALATRLNAWDARRTAKGLAPWAMPLKIGTHTVGGMLALRLLASAKGWRARGSRFQLEQQGIEHWLAGVIEGARRDPALGLELARCGRLIKGYGSTNERGKENLLHVLEHLTRLPDPKAAALAVRAAREAALADDSGKALDRSLATHGAPARPIKAVPIRFVRRTTTNTATQGKA